MLFLAPPGPQNCHTTTVQRLVYKKEKLKAELAKHGGLFKLALQEHRTEILPGFIHKYFQLETKLREKIEAL